jgi:hypothetical protein
MRLKAVSSVARTLTASIIVVGPTFRQVIEGQTVRDEDALELILEGTQDLLVDSYKSSMLANPLQKGGGSFLSFLAAVGGISELGVTEVKSVTSVARGRCRSHAPKVTAPA